MEGCVVALLLRHGLSDACVAHLLSALLWSPTWHLGAADDLNFFALRHQRCLVVEMNCNAVLDAKGVACRRDVLE